MTRKSAVDGAGRPAPTRLSTAAIRAEHLAPARREQNRAVADGTNAVGPTLAVVLALLAAFAAAVMQLSGPGTPCSPRRAGRWCSRSPPPTT